MCSKNVWADNRVSSLENQENPALLRRVIGQSAKAMLAICNLADHCNGLAVTHRGCADHVVHYPLKRRSYRCELVAEKVHEDAQYRALADDVAIFGCRAKNARLRTLDDLIIA